MAGFLTNVGHVFTTLGQKMVEGTGQPAPQYQIDPDTGTTVPVQGEPAPGQMFKNLLVGALSGLYAGSQVRGGFGAQVGAGFEGAQEQKARQDQTARTNAQQQFQNQEQAQQDMDAHTLRKAQLAALQQKSIQDAALFEQAKQKNSLDIGKLEQGLADSYNANLMAGAKPFQHMGQEVPAFDTLQQAEDFANSHPEDVVSGFTTQIHRTPDGKWQITQLPTTEQEYTFDIGGKKVTQRMNPAAAQTVYNAIASAKKTNADIAETNARTALVNAQTKKVNQDIENASGVDGAGLLTGGPSNKQDRSAALKAVNSALTLANQSTASRRKADTILAEANKNGYIDGPEANTLLSLHLGTTFGGVKGMRLGEFIVKMHEQGRSLPEDIEAGFNSVIHGGNLSAKQVQAFYGLMKETENENWQTVLDSAKQQGFNVDTSKLPEGLQLGSNKGGDLSPAAQAVLNKYKGKN